MGPTIGQRILSRDNNCDLVRLIAAWMVLLSHSWAFVGRGAEEPLGRLLGHDNLGSIAVAAFFVLSGLLVTASFQNDPHPGRYLLRRAIRIYPGLIVNTLIAILVVGAIATTLPLREYLANGRTWTYLANGLAYRHADELPGVFEDLHVPAVNGSLWTLRSELHMYLLLLVLGCARLLRPWVLVTLVAAALLTYGCLLGSYLNPARRISQVPLERTVLHAIYFFSGGLFFLLRDRVRLNGWAFVACLAAIVLSVGQPWGKCVFQALLPYVVICLALWRCKPAAWLHRVGDLSYGTYLYAFPIQQLVLHFGGKEMPLPQFVLISTLLTLGVAYLSWRFVEKPAMKLKRRTPQPLPLATASAESVKETSSVCTTR